MPRVLVSLMLTLLFAACSGGETITRSEDLPAPGDVQDATNPTDLAEQDESAPDQGEPDYGQPDQGEPDTVEPDTMGPECAPGEGCFLDPCTENSDCLSGWCVEHLGDEVCSSLCTEECPPGWNCQQVAGTVPDVVYICVSDYANLCRPCATGADCLSVGTEDVCVDYGHEGSFCGGSCATDDDCPWGFSCGEAVTVNGISTSQCMAEAGVCPCTEKSVALALSTPCERENEFGLCTGHRICTDEGLSDCDAAEPAPESCDGLDNNCDGDVDEGTCDDDNECTEDLCLGEAGCQHTPLSNGECKDGDACTVGDHCEEGVCVGSLIGCDDGNPCTDDSCDGLGGCLFEPNNADCDDGNPCTVADECNDGECGGYDVECDCQQDSDCVALEDGNLCNGTLYCDLGQLPYRCAVEPGTEVLCEAPEPGPDAFCLANLCDPQSGTCTLEPAHEGFACEDGNPCTLGEQCQAGSCTGGVPTGCDDGNPCTEDGCDEAGGCVHTPVAGACDDGNACTVGDHCNNGLCTHDELVDCDDDNVCTTDGCDPQAGCFHSLNSAPCNDGDLCTVNDSCQLGECKGGGALNCNDNNPCTADSCAPQSGCQFTPVGGDCDDGSVCTVGDTCANGWCLPGPVIDCADDNPCTDDGCDPVTGCIHAPNQAPCDDGNDCTINDTCGAGSCQPGVSLDCEDGNPCTDHACLPDGGCVTTFNSDPCNDANACTTNEFCFEGVCGGGVDVDCDDDNLCTDDSCDANLGCLHTANTVACDDGDACTVDDQCADGACQPGGEALDCDDGNECTDDACLPETGCVHTPVADDTPCAPDGTCQGGTCVPDIQADCLDVKEKVPAAASGVYELDPDGDGGDPAYPAWCEMTQDGGGWTLVMSLNTADGHMSKLTDSIWTTHDESGDFGSRWSQDYKSQAATDVAGTDLLVIVRNHNASEGGSIVGWRSWHLDGEKTFQSFFDVSMGSSTANAAGGCNSGYSGDGRQQTTGIKSAGVAAPFDTFTNQADQVYSNSYYGSCGDTQDGFRLSSYYRWANNSNVGLGLQMDGAGDTTYTLEAGALLKKDTYPNPQRYCSGGCQGCTAYPDGSNGYSSTKAAIGTDHYSYQCNCGVSYRYEWYIR